MKATNIDLELILRTQGVKGLNPHEVTIDKLRASVKRVLDRGLKGTKN